MDMRQVMEATKAASIKARTSAKIATGYADVDEVIHAVYPGDLVVLAGRPGTGKTAFAVNWMTHLAQTGKKVVFFSAEMAAEKIGARILSMMSGVPMQTIADGAYTDEQYEKDIRLACEAASRLTLDINPDPEETPQKILEYATNYKEANGIDFVVIDHLQKLHDDVPAKDRRLEVESMTNKFCTMAKQLDIPILLLSQVSRYVEQRKELRPQLSDLKESGSIEQDADVVMFIYDDADITTIKHIAVEKNRNGEPGRSTEIKFIGQTQTFLQLTADEKKALVEKKRFERINKEKEKALKKQSKKLEKEAAKEEAKRLIEGPEPAYEQLGWEAVAQAKEVDIPW